MSSSIADARACICSVLSFARWIARPVSSISRADAGRGLADPHLRLRGGVLRLDHFLLRAERLDLRGRAAARSRRASPAGPASCCTCVSRSWSCCCDRRPCARAPAARDPRGPPRAPGAPASSSLTTFCSSCLRLELEPLLRGDDVGDAALDVLELLELLLVRVVERLGRVLGPVEQLRELRLDDRRRSRAIRPAIPFLLVAGVPVSLPPCWSSGACIRDWLSNAYLVADEEGGTAVFVDSGAPLEPLLGGGRALAGDAGARPPHALARRPRRARGRARRCRSRPSRAGDGSGGLRVEAIATPGHSDDMVASSSTARRVFTGDTLFKDAVGGGELRAGARVGDGRLHGAPARDARAARPHRRDDDRPRVGGEPVRPRLARRRARGHGAGDASAGEDATLDRLVARTTTARARRWVRFDDGHDAIVGGSRVERL